MVFRRRPPLAYLRPLRVFRSEPLGFSAETSGYGKGTTGYRGRGLGYRSDSLVYRRHSLVHRLESPVCRPESADYGSGSRVYRSELPFYRSGSLGYRRETLVYGGKTRFSPALMAVYRPPCGAYRPGLGMARRFPAFFRSLANNRHWALIFFPESGTPSAISY